MGHGRIIQGPFPFPCVSIVLPLHGNVFTGLRRTGILHQKNDLTICATIDLLGSAHVSTLSLERKEVPLRPFIAVTPMGQTE